MENVISFVEARRSRPIPARQLNAADRHAIEVTGDCGDENCYVFAIEKRKHPRSKSWTWVRFKRLAGPVSYFTALIEARKWCAKMDLPRLP